MTDTQRYAWSFDTQRMEPTNHGGWGTWSDVEALQKELLDVTAKALAAVWLVPEEVGKCELDSLREEARRVFMGEDKKTIAKLHDDLRYAQERYQHAVRPPRPGIGAVFGCKSGGREYKDVRVALGVISVQHDRNDNLVLEVRLP